MAKNVLHRVFDKFEFFNVKYTTVFSHRNYEISHAKYKK